MRWPWVSPRWRDVDLLALDLETTGLDPRGDEILAAGAVPIRSGTIRWGERWSARAQALDPQRAASAAVAVHGILPIEARSAPPLAELADQLEARLSVAALVVHCAALDVAMLRRAWARLGRRLQLPPVIDTMELIARLDRRRRVHDPDPRPLPRQLDAIRGHLGLPGHGQHDALADALATAELFLVLQARLGIETLRRLVG